MSKNKELMPKLCFRCEHRCRANEIKMEKNQKGFDLSSPRAECSQSEISVFSCYMYKPVEPMTVRHAENSEGLEFPGSVSSKRVKANRLLNLRLNAIKSGNELLLYYEPKIDTDFPTLKERISNYFKEIMIKIRLIGDRIRNGVPSHSKV